jgi:hypothetical protein
MRLLETFTLDIQPGDEILLARMRIALQRHSADESGRVFLTPECLSLDEVEGHINALQDELDQLRQRARCAYQAP